MTRDRERAARQAEHEIAAIAAALEEQIRAARFVVERDQENESYGYVVDHYAEGGDELVLSGALPFEIAVERRDEQRNRAWRYLWAKRGFSRDYLGFGAAVVSQPQGVKADLVMVPAEHAHWQLGRLASGLQTVGLSLFETAAEALVAMAEAHQMGVI